MNAARTILRKLPVWPDRLLQTSKSRLYRMLSLLGFFLIGEVLLFWFSLQPLGAQARQGTDPGSQPLFEAEAQVLVLWNRVPLIPRKASDQDPPEQQDLIAHMVLLKSPGLIERTVKNHKLKSLKSFAGRDPVKVIMESLSIRRPSRSGYILIFSFRGPEAEDCSTVLKAVLQTYTDFLEEAAQRPLKDWKAILEREKELLEKELMERRVAYRDFLRKAFPTENEIKLRQARRTVLETRREALLVSRAEMEGRQAWLENALAEKRNQTAILIKVKEWAVRSGFDKLPEEARQGKDPVAAYLETLKADLEENHSVESALEKLLKSELAEIKKLQLQQFEEERLRIDLENSQKLYQSMLQSLSELNMASIVDPENWTTQ